MKPGVLRGVSARMAAGAGIVLRTTQTTEVRMRIQPRRQVLGALIFVAAAIGGCSTAPPRTTAERDADKQIAAEVSSALNADSLMYARHIDVRSERGVVYLGGYVWDDSDLFRAEQIAAMVPGVKRVIDELELERQGIDNSPVTR